MASCISEPMRNMLTSPNWKNGLGDTSYREKQGFNDGLARSGVWWVSTPRVVTGSILSVACKLLSQFLIGWVPWGERSSQMSSLFDPSPFMDWPLSDIFFPPFLVTYSCLYVLNSPIEWARVKTPRHSTIPLSGFSRTRILMAITSAGCHSRLVVLESGPLKVFISYTALVPFCQLMPRAEPPFTTHTVDLSVYFLLLCLPVCCAPVCVIHLSSNTAFTVSHLYPKTWRACSDL